MLDQKHTLGDTNRPKKSLIPLTFMAALFAVFSFAAPASAGTMECAQVGEDVVCDYAADIGGPTYELWQETNNPRCDSSENATDSMTCAGACSSPATGLYFSVSIDGPHADNDTASGFFHVQVADFDCSAVPVVLSFDPTAANGALSSVADGAQDIFWDSAGNVLLIVASVGITFALFYLIYRLLKRRR